MRRVRPAGPARPTRRGVGDEGFTLIELMVVVLIIAILISIAIPTFIGARQKAQDRAAQSSLRIGLTAIRTAYIDGQSYLTATTQLASIEPSLTYVTAPGASSNGQHVLAVHAVDDQDVGMAVLAGDGVCWQLFDAAGSLGTSYGSVRNSTATTCTAPTAVLPAATW